LDLTDEPAGPDPGRPPIQSEPWDLEKEEPGQPDQPTKPGVAPVYDSARDRERVRGTLAYMLLCLLAFVTVACISALIFDRITASELKDLATTFFTPLLGVFGTITGFYYGTVTASSPPSDPAVSSGGPSTGEPTGGPLARFRRTRARRLLGL